MSSIAPRFKAHRSHKSRKKRFSRKPRVARKASIKTSVIFNDAISGADFYEQ